jgi:hypothetical protein
MKTASQYPSHWPTLITSALLLGLGFLAYGATGHDDAHINFWSAWTLLEHHALLNYNGDHIEQTTNLLQDFLTAFLHLTSRLDLVTCGFLVDIFSAWGCCWLTFSIARKLQPSTANWTVFLLLSSSSFMLWSFGGMGATLAAFCLLLTMTTWSKWIDTSTPDRQLRFALCASSAALTLERPEMPLIAIMLAGWMLAVNIYNPSKRKRCLQLLALSLVFTALLFGWQHLYFNSWLPVPALAKQGGNLQDKLQQGFIYIVFNSVLNPAAALAILLLPVCWWQQRGHSDTSNQKTLFYLLTGATCIYLGFIWAAGGDWMQAGRFFVPILPLTSILTVMALGNTPWRWTSHIALTLLCSFQIFQQFTTTIPKLSHGIPVWAQFRIADEHQRYSLFEKLNQEHLRDMGVIDHLAQIIPILHANLNRPVILMSGQAGMVFYYTAQQFGGDVNFRDLRGLVEDSLTRCSITDNVKRGSQGIFWGYKEFFSMLPDLQTSCGIMPPDLIYDINDMTQKLGKTLEPYGYTMIHSETGFMIENRTNLPYNRLLSPNMIFIRNDLLPLLLDSDKTVVDYSKLPLRSRL